MDEPVKLKPFEALAAAITAVGELATNECIEDVRFGRFAVGEDKGGVYWRIRTQRIHGNTVDAQQERAYDWQIRRVTEAFEQWLTNELRPVLEEARPD